MNSTERAGLQAQLVAANARVCAEQAARQALSAQRRADVGEMAFVVTPLIGSPLLVGAGYVPVDTEKLVNVGDIVRCLWQRWYLFSDRTSDYRMLVITGKGKLLALDARGDAWRRVRDPEVFGPTSCELPLHAMAMRKFGHLKERLNG